MVMMVVLMAVTVTVAHAQLPRLARVFMLGTARF